MKTIQTLLAIGVIGIISNFNSDENISNQNISNTPVSVETKKQTELIDLGKNFKKDDKYVYYNKKIIEGADPETFELKNDYAVDKNFVYMYNTSNSNWEKLENADVTTFKKLYSEEAYSQNYYKDKNHAYYKNRLIEGTDPETFEIKNDDISKDKNNFYYQGNILDDIDYETFKLLDDYYAKDKNNVYCYHIYWFKLNGVNLSTFQSLNNGYSKDKNNVYFWNFFTGATKIEGADSETFDVLDYGYAKDKYSAYLGDFYNGNEKLEEIDLQTFKPLNKNFFKDKNNVFVFSPKCEVHNEIKKIKNANAETFEVINEFLAKDKNNIYVYEKSFNFVDVKSFKFIGDYYAKDNNFVYFIENITSAGPNILANGLRKIESIDAKTFEILDSEFAQDKNNCYKYLEVVNRTECKRYNKLEEKVLKSEEKFYKIENDKVFYNGKEVIGVDIKTFEILDSDYAKDKNNVYFSFEVGEQPKKIEGADPETFKMLGDGIFQDKNNCYKDGAIVDKSVCSDETSD